MADENLFPPPYLLLNTLTVVGGCRSRTIGTDGETDTQPLIAATTAARTARRRKLFRILSKFLSPVRKLFRRIKRRSFDWKAALTRMIQDRLNESRSFLTILMEDLKRKRDTQATLREELRAAATMEQAAHSSIQSAYDHAITLRDALHKFISNTSSSDGNDPFPGIEEEFDRLNRRRHQHQETLLSEAIQYDATFNKSIKAVLKVAQWIVLVISVGATVMVTLFAGPLGVDAVTLLGSVAEATLMSCIRKYDQKQKKLQKIEEALHEFVKVEAAIYASGDRFKNSVQNEWSWVRRVAVQHHAELNIKMSTGITVVGTVLDTMGKIIPFERNQDKLATSLDRMHEEALHSQENINEVAKGLLCLSEQRSGNNRTRRGTRNTRD